MSVVIPAYNEENYIGRTLQSLLQQDFQDFEIIVVSNPPSKLALTHS
ncbi:glycosyltransferase family 2 protein [bacterium]|nr:glycosyltransferase family 2 protein [bacterium]